ncbi:MAG: hypothetical protein ACAH59_04600 [Pseudobdellovibrionaceae bacterium]
MTFRKLFLAMSFSLPGLALSDPPVSNGVDAKIKEWQAARKEYAQQAKSAESYLKMTQAAFEGCQKQDSCNENTINDLKGRMAKHENTISVMGTGIKHLDEQIAKTQQEYEQSKSESRVNSLLATHGVRANVAQLRADIKDQQILAGKIENQIDREATGIYLQNKIYALLNSQVICSATARCGTKEKMVIDKNRMKEIFPDHDPSDILTGDFYHERALKSKESLSTPATPEAPAPGAQ